MNRPDIHNKLHYVLGLLIAFTMPFAKFTPLFIGLLFVNWLVEGRFRQKLKNIASSKLALTFIAFYILHLIGLMYTTNTDAGWFDMEVKLSLIIFPIVIAGKPYHKKQLDHLFIALIIGLVYSSLYMLSRSVSLYLMNGQNTFFYQEFSTFIHTSYISMYMNVALCWLLISTLKKVNDQYFSTFVSVLLMVFFGFMIFMLSAKSGILTLLLIAFGLIVYYVFYRRKYLVGALGFVLVISGFFTIDHFVPGVHNRIGNFLKALTDKNDNETVNSTANRLLIWQSSNQVIKNNFIAGVGTGDVKEALCNEYEVRGMENALIHQLNAHNEFYQVFIALGVIGFLLLCLCLLYPFINTFKTGKLLYRIFLAIIMINFFSESMLETKAGVMFYAFFNDLLCFVDQQEKEPFKSLYIKQ